VEVRIDNLVKRFGDTIAVDDISFKVNSGEFVVLLGPSGCGKTTTLRCLAGLETPDSGDIFIGETRANDLAPRERDVAMVFQTYALYPHKSVYDNLKFPLKMHRVPNEEIGPRVNEIAKLLSIEHLLNRKPKQLSGGEQQRVALGRSLVRQPKVFLMDEPLSNLDAQLRLRTRTEIKRLHEQLKITTVYVTHDQAEAMSMADKVAIMNKGKLVQYDDPFTIYGNPANTFVANFVGSPAMNTIRASVVRKGETVILDAGSFQYSPPSSWIDAIESHAQSNEVQIGIRPENLLLSATRSVDSVFEAEVYVVEPLGASTVVDLKIGEDILKAVVQGVARNRVGSKVWTGFSPDNIRIFDGKSGDLII
jgi:multiple sugar transport system ATP-binding protein